MPTKTPTDFAPAIEMPGTLESRGDVAVAAEPIDDATDAAGQPLAPIPQYEVIERLVHDGVDYPVGSRVELSAERAESLTRAGVVRRVE